MFAAPSLPLRKTVKQPDGTSVTLVRHGDEYLSYFATEDGYIVAADSAGAYRYVATMSESEWALAEILAHAPAARSAAEREWLAAHGITKYAPSLTAAQARSRASVASSIGVSSKPSGEKTYPVILLQYQDVKFTLENPVDTFRSQMNKQGFSGGKARGSVRDYFSDQSRGKYVPTFDIIGPVTLSHDRAYYGAHSGTATDSRVSEMVSEAVSLAKAQGADFKQYADASGRVPIVGVVFAGEGENSSLVDDAVWAKYQPYTINFGGGYIDSYLVTNEITHPYKVDSTGTATLDFSVTDIEGIGTFCHEFSHFLGLPDFYDTRSSGSSFCMSFWSLMDSGNYLYDGYVPAGYTAYEKHFMGWMDIDTLRTRKQLVRLGALGTAAENALYILNDNDASGNEYYILENRQPSKWYIKQLGKGMLVVHVDYNRSAWTQNTVNVNSSLRRMSIVPADGSTPTEDEASYADYRGDLFPGTTLNDALSDETSPSFAQHTGAVMGKYLSQITDTAGVVSFVYMGKGVLKAPESLRTYATDDVNYVKWDSVAGATAYAVVVESAAGDTLLADTVAADSARIGALQTEKQLTVKVTALAADYIDSPEAALQAENPVGIRGVSLKDWENEPCDVYDAAGVRVLSRVTPAVALRKLPRGVYVLKSPHGTQKLLVK